jgi:hypothetical protein
MQKKQRIIDLGLAIIVCCSAGSAAAAALDPQKFVAGWPLDASGEETFYDLPLTHEVYRFGRSLDELAVLDANREPMPFYRVAVASPAISESRTSLAVSPIYVQQKVEAGADLSISLQRDRTDVSIKRPGQEESSAELVAFVADARGVEHLPYALELQWQPLERPFLMNVTVEQSNDLNNWRRVGGGSIAALAIEDAPLAHRNIEIAGRPGGYYRVTWNRSVDDWVLERVEVITTSLTEQATFGRVALPAVPVTPEDAPANARFFDAGGALPVTRVDLVMPSSNQWVNASIYAANSIDGPWRKVRHWQLFYDVEFEGERLRSEPLDVGRVEARFWRVLFGKDIAPEDIDLSLEYPEERLRFSANGEAPYQLVGGTLLQAAGPDPTLAAVMKALSPDPAKIATARVGRRVNLGGPGALEIPTEFPWRTVYLWAALLAAAAVVGFMAIKLARDMFATQ